MKVVVAYIVFGLEVVDDGAILSGIGCGQEKGSFVCKHRRREEVKRKYGFLIIKSFKELVKKLHSHCNVTPYPGKVKPL